MILIEGIFDEALSGIHAAPSRNSPDRRTKLCTQPARVRFGGTWGRYGGQRSRLIDRRHRADDAIEHSPDRGRTEKAAWRSGRCANPRIALGAVPASCARGGGAGLIHKP